MPWKNCPKCGGASYSAAEERDTWPCPYCGAELAGEQNSLPPGKIKETAPQSPKTAG